MPNLDFYAAQADFDQVLALAFASNDFRVYESYSPFGEPLVEFHDVAELKQRHPVGQCAANGPSVLLALCPAESSALLRIERIALSPERCNGHTFRERCSGWGVIQLQLGGQGPAGLVHSHTNHNSEARARHWHQTCPQLGDPGLWDWRRVAALSRTLNRHIASGLACAKVGSRPVLPAASQLLAQGMAAI